MLPDTRPQHAFKSLHPFGLSVVTVAGAAVVAWPLADLLPQAALTMLFLAAVLFVASRTSLLPGLLAAVLGFFSINYFFTAPRFTLHVDKLQDIATLLLFLPVAMVTGKLAAGMRIEADENEANIRKLSILSEFGRRMLGAVDIAQVYSRLAGELRTVTGNAWALVAPGGNGQPDILHQSTSRPFSRGQLQDLWDHTTTTFSWTPGWGIYPLITDTGRVALVVVESRDSSPDDLVSSLCQQASAALERMRLAEHLASARLEAETEQLRSALLSSVSHDLRTPLASIIGSTTSLRDLGDTLSEPDRSALLDNVLSESRRLDRYIQNLLDMTRLGHGSIPLHRDWVDVRDLVNSALARVRSIPDPSLPVDVNIAPDIPLLWIHGALIEQALVNLVDNALRFSPPGGRVRIEVSAANDHVTLSVEDEGIGIPEPLRDRVFDMFYTAQAGDRSASAGTGLGLAICKGLVGAHHGTITALPGRGGRGTCMRVRLPLLQPGADRAA